MRHQPFLPFYLFTFLPFKKAIEFFTLRSSLLPYKGVSLFYLFTFLLLKALFYLYNAHLLEQTVGVSPAVHEVDHVAHVDAYAASELRVEPDVARERVPVAVEGKTDELALAVEDR